MAGQPFARVPGALLFISMALTALGSLRDAVSPGGYWLAWFVWALLAFLANRRNPRLPGWRGVPTTLWASYGALAAGMFVAALANGNGASAYQGLKIIVILGMFLAMWALASQLDWQQLTRAAAWTLAVVLASLVVSRFWTPGFITQPLLDGPREGSVFAAYGVLWKAGALFLPLFLADWMVTPRMWPRNAILIAACIFLVLIDGSRTGLLLLFAIFFGFLAFALWRGELRVLLRQSRWLWIVPLVLIGLQMLNMALSPSAGGPQAGGGWAGALGALNPLQLWDAAVARLSETRIGAGDPARMQLLQAAVHQLLPCQPLGCGFYTTGTDIGTGGFMAVHNAYLAALGDFGILGLAGMLGFLVAAWLPLWRVLRRRGERERDYFVVATAGSALAYGMSLMLNTFTTEMSEWGYLILMLAFAWAPPRGA